MATELDDRDFLKLSGILFPTGRAFRIHEGSNKERFFTAFSDVENEFFNDVMSTLDSLLPDNDNFTSEDATIWETRLGLITNLATPLADRKLAILRKMASPGVNPAKAHYLWLQQQLQDAGFAVYVHENKFPSYPSGYTRVEPSTLNPSIFSDVEQGMFEQGQVQQGGYYKSVVANSIYNSEDIGFNFGNDFGGVFFIGSSTIGNYVNVLASRELEFRQLLLSLKQINTAAILFINFV